MPLGSTAAAEIPRGPRGGLNKMRGHRKGFQQKIIIESLASKCGRA